jgi:transcriptional regulator of acetoin/glycerol metabolism
MKGYGERPRTSIVSNLPPPMGASSPPVPSTTSAPPPPTSRRAPTEEELRGLLERHRGNIAAVGRELGKERMQIHRWLKKYGIDLGQYR